MRKCMAGVAKLSIGLGVIVMLLSLVLVYSPPAAANPDVAGKVWFSASEYFTESTATVYINDSERAGGGTIANVHINSTVDPTGIYITVTEESTANGTFSGTFTFVYNQSSVAATSLNVTDRNNVTVQYTDTAPLNTVIYNASTFNYTFNASFSMNASIFGTENAVGLTLYDNDTNTNSDAVETKSIVAVSPSSTNISVTLVETGADTGNFTGNFTFSLAGSNDGSDILGVNESDVIYIYVTDSLNTYGSSVTVVNSSVMARNATILFDNNTYYPADTVVVSVHDNDTEANTNSTTVQTVTVNVSSNSDPGGINITLTETGNDTGIFNGTLTLTNNLSSSDVSNILNVTTGNTLTGAYTDKRNETGGTNYRVTNSTPTYTYTTDGDLSTDVTLCSANSTVNVTLNDSDANSDPNTKNSKDLMLNTTTVPTGISIKLWETGVNTAMFEGNFTFSINGNTSASTNTITTAIINASNNDEVNVIYNDTTNSSGDYAIYTANMTFYRATSGIIWMNWSALNNTYFAVDGDSTVFINLTDDDPFANTDTAAYDSFNITLENLDTGCVINLTLTESSNNTGIFNGTFNLNETDCHGGRGMMNYTVGGEDWLEVNYTDARNGTASANATNITRVLADDKAPVFSSASTLDADLTYNPGEMVNLTVELDQPGANISANFSVVDSTYTNGAENVTDYGNGTYKINYTISSGTAIVQGHYTLNISAEDGAGNGPTADTSITLTLSNMTVNISLLNFTHLAPSGLHYLLIEVDNGGSVTQENITQHFDIYREANLTYTTAGNSTKLQYFMVPYNVTRITFTIETNNSNASITSRIHDNTDARQSTALSGNIYPSVSADSAELWYINITVENVTSADTTKIIPNLRVYINTSTWFSSNMTSGADNFSAGSNTTINLSLRLPYLNILPSIYNGTVVYNNSNTSISIPLFFNITAPQVGYEFNISSPLKTLPNDTATLHVNIMRDFKTFRIDVNNTGNLNLSGLWMNLSSGSATETSFNYSNAITMNISSVSGSPGSVTSNRHQMTFVEVVENSTAYINLNFDSSEQGTEGLYTIYLDIFSTDGQPFNVSRLTLRVNLTRFLNITILNVTFNDTEEALPRPGHNVTLNVSVKYLNGDAVAGLVLWNFSIYDTWTTGNGVLLNLTPGNLSIHDFALNGSGVYMFNYTVPPSNTSARAEYHLHAIIMEINVSNNNTGNGSSTYNMSVPNLDMYFDSFATAMNNNTGDAFSITAINNGTAPIYNVTLNWTQNGTGCVAFNVSSCPMMDELNASTNTSACSVHATANSSACTENVTFSLAGMSAYGNEYNGTLTSKTIDVTVSGGSSSDDSTGGGDGTIANCTTDDDCSALYSCEDGVCEVITCPTGYIDEHVCYSYSYGFTILSYEPVVTLLYGSSNTTTVNVNNTKNTTTVRTEVSVTGISVSVSPSEKVLASGANQIFTLNITMADDTDVGTHTATFKAYRSSDSSIKAEATIDIKVLPTEAKKAEIEQSYQNYSSVVQGLVNEFQAVKAGGIVSAANISQAERAVNRTQSLLADAKAALDAGDYVTANDKLNELQLQIGNARATLDAIKTEQQAGGSKFLGDILVWIVIAVVVIAAVGLVVYMFLPERRGHMGHHMKVPKPGVGRGPSGGFLSKLRGRFQGKPETMTEKMKNYAKGYQRHKGLTYQRKESLSKKMGRIFKKRK